ncbi:hypothetical protein KHQ81_15705 (plasmid) [Mycoplasmatota bacterium]|nr:hypothetical protein KHQ81_15705 [Mycoplasmatota bacterium]
MKNIKLIDYINQFESEREFEVGDQYIDVCSYFYSKTNYDKSPLAKWVADNCDVIKVVDDYNLIINLYDVVHDNIDILKSFAKDYYKNTSFLQDTIHNNWDNDDWVADFVEDFNSAIIGDKSENYEKEVIKALRESNFIQLSNQLKNYNIIGTHDNEVFKLQEKFELKELLKEHPNIYKLNQLVENLNSDWESENYQFQLVKNDKNLEL